MHQANCYWSQILCEFGCDCFGEAGKLCEHFIHFQEYLWRQGPDDEGNYVFDRTIIYDLEELERLRQNPPPSFDGGQGGIGCQPH